eukprot:TRINITY_DN107619_c0_g1_i1.p1 TRINITY_DN107619_c0_g1~~TRINITY_DN107619_c0_g1_i1.p1  ORF type:complete len:153 (-),score=24.74 TRINITY_DN107619_c0_g1_i1:103-531(-)
MGADASRCCSTSNATAADELSESDKEEAPGAAKLPDLSSAPPVPAAPAAAQIRRGNDREYSVTVDKSTGARLGIDVDHQDGESLLIESINDGLIKDWNRSGAVEQVRVGDRVVEVNGMRHDVLQLVDQCKKNQVLALRICRG